MLTGKGMYLWVTHRAGTPQQIADTAVEVGLTHVIIKVLDGYLPYNKYLMKDGKEYFAAPTGHDEVPDVVAALKAEGIEAWGYQYTYGKDPVREASAAEERALSLGLDGFVINAEKEYKEIGMERQARIYCSNLYMKLHGDMPIAFSSFRYPNVHRPLPFEAFLEVSDLNMPQVYWAQSHNPAFQLNKSVAQYNALSVKRPIFPTGAAYSEGGWRPTADEIQAFMQAARVMDMSGCNFWEWRDALMRFPEYKQTIKDFTFGELPPPPLTVEQRLERLESEARNHGWFIS